MLTHEGSILTHKLLTCAHKASSTASELQHQLSQITRRSNEAKIASLSDVFFNVDTRWWILENLYPQGTSRMGREASWVRFSEKVVWFGFCCKQPMHVSSTEDEMNYVVVFIADSSESPFSKGGWKRHPSKSIETASSISPKPPNDPHKTEARGEPQKTERIIGRGILLSRQTVCCLLL